MHIVFRSGAGERELDVELTNPDATVADLVRAVTGRPVPPTAATIDDRKVTSASPLTEAGLHEGAVVAVAAHEHPSDGVAPAGTIELVVVAGRSAGTAHPLPTGRTILGRDPACGIVVDHPEVSRRHCALELSHTGTATVRDLGSANGTFVDGALTSDRPRPVGHHATLEIGPVAFMIRTGERGDRPRGMDQRRRLGPAGTLPFNRPPRAALPPAPAALEPPTAATHSGSAYFSAASIFGPLVIAGIMVAVLGDWRFALFALLSPLIAIGSYLESRRRDTRQSRKSRGTFRNELDAFTTQTIRARATELARLRALNPDPAEVLRRAALPSVRLWERRTTHDDFLRLSAGVATVAWTPPLRQTGGGRLADEVSELVERISLPSAPVCVDLSDGGVVGVVGDRTVTLAVARSLLCQAAVHHGPADLTIGVFVDPGRESLWEWTKWLPHTRADGRQRWLAARRDHSDALLRTLADGAGAGTVLAVFDSDMLMEGSHAPGRDLLNAHRRADGAPDAANRFGAVGGNGGRPVAGIVVASSADRLPAACTTIVDVGAGDGASVVRRPGAGTETAHVLLAGLSPTAATRCARQLARFEDPELRQAGAGLPDSVRLLPLLDLDGVDGESVRKRWRRAGSDGTVTVPVGVAENGVFTLDLIADGPHGLVGGTTGSGKSELLRSLVAALAVQADPQHLTFILMDFKGGAAFDECARLPHTVGMVTDLDERLGERALRALEAEIRHREHVLRAAGAANLPEYLSRPGRPPLPRLLVVIDEFATMAAELPDMLTSLVSVAQRGRTLGVHMILATQRPSGAVNDNIRTNTNLRVALRVQDAADSQDVIDRRDAAQLSRHTPGRAYVRLGPGEIVPIQTALITCTGDESSDGPVRVAPFTFGPARHDGPAAPEQRKPDRDRPSDLARLVQAVNEANQLEGIAPPRRPWPEPLPDRIDLAELLSEAPGEAVIARVDDPDRQRQYPVGWNLPQGNLLLVGIPGSGTTTTLAALAIGLATVHPPADLGLYVLDFGAGELQALDALPHVGAVIAAGDRERQVRLVRWLRAELDRRRGGRAGRRTVVLIDNLAAMRSDYDDADGLALMETVGRLYADGPELGIWFAVAADRLSTVPNAWAAVTTQKWLFRLTERYDYVSAGLTAKDAPEPVPGRAVIAAGGLHVHVGLPTPSVAAAVGVASARWPDATRVADPIEALPSDVGFDRIGGIADVTTEPWRIPYGIRESDLDRASLVLYDGEHALVAGPARSGKSTALATLAASLRAAGGVHLAGIAGRRSPLRDCPSLDRFAPAGGEATALLAQLRVFAGPLVLFIDDAETFDDADSAIEGLLSTGRGDRHVIAAARADALPSMYGHWTKTVRRSKVGLLLRPNVDMDGDLLGMMNLPRRAPVSMTVGRGYAIHDGDLELVQVARPA